MVQPTLETDDEAQKIDTLYSADGAAGIKLGIGEVTFGGGLTPKGKAHAIGTHLAGDTFAVGGTGRVVVLAGVEPAADEIVPMRVDASGRAVVALSGLGNHYSLAALTGIIPAALGANSEIFQFRNAHATKLAVIRRVRISAAVTTTMFAAGVPVQIDLVKATAWTVAGTGGATPTLAALLKRRTSMDSTVVAAGDIRIATTAALGAGTKTLEGSSLANVMAGGPITGSLNGTIIQPGFVLFEAKSDEEGHPLLLVTNEGFVIRSVAVPATGTWMVAVEVDWAEVDAY